MSDELELLKKDWQKHDKELPKYTASEIYPMLLKKSSSIVKWIFIISVVEFAFWNLVTLFLGPVVDGDIKSSKALENFEKYFLFVHITFLMVFIILFYQNFRKISAVDSAKKLMKNILKTRKTVTYYIYSSLILLLIAAVVTIELVILNNPEIFENVSKTSIYLVMIIIGLATLSLFWFIYRLLYGRLMNKLIINYKELSELNQ